MDHLKNEEHIMKSYLYPAIAIIITAAVLVAINEFTDLTFIKDYALVFIIAAMFFGLWLGKAFDKRSGK